MQNRKLDCGHESGRFLSTVRVGESTICIDCYQDRMVANYKPKVLRREKHPLLVGCVTYVGYASSDYPYKTGNCCGILNMYAENVEEAVRRCPELRDECLMEIVEVRGREKKRVIDPRIPTSWLNRWCSSCGVFEGANPKEQQ